MILDFKKLFYGNSETSKVYYGNILIYDKSASADDYLTFTSNADGSIVKLASKASTHTELKYSYDKIIWTSLLTNSGITLNTGETIYLKGKGASSATTNFTLFSITGNISASGSIMSILEEGDPRGTTLHTSLACYNLFKNCTGLVSSPKLPATTLSSNCYNYMFSGCTNLKVAPELPATELTYACYSHMFLSCSSIETLPKNYLPATTLTGHCYRNMFSGCRSLKNLPDLPATTLTDYCYNYMFSSCDSLKLSTTQTSNYLIPYRIPTEGTGTTASEALTNMFLASSGTWTGGTPRINTTYYLWDEHYDPDYLTFTAVEDTDICWLVGGSLSESPQLYYRINDGDWIAYTLNATVSLTAGQRCAWKNDVKWLCIYPLLLIWFTSTGKVEAEGNILSLINYEPLYNFCFYFLFNGCTNLLKAPSFPATTASACYYYMFYNCTGLTSLPELPATDLSSSCYEGMFSGCTGIKLSETETAGYVIPYRIPTTGTGTMEASALANMFADTGGTFKGTPVINTTYYINNNI